MKKLAQTLLLVLAVSATTFAGDIPGSDKTPPPPPPPPASSSTTTIMDTTLLTIYLAIIKA